MKSRWIRLTAAALVAAGTLALAPDDAHADRRSSLSGNLLIQDKKDMYLFPQLAVDHRNLVYVDYYPGGSLQGALGGREFDESTQGLVPGASAMGGAAGILFGQENFAMALTTRRGDIFGAAPAAFLGAGDIGLYGPYRLRSWSYLGYNSPVPTGVGNSTGTAPSASGTDMLAPLQVFDLLTAFGFGGTHKLGFRLSYGQALYSIQEAGVDQTDRQAYNTTAFNLAAGYTLDASFQLDLALELGVGIFSSRQTTTNPNAPDYRNSANLAPSFSITGRALIPTQDAISIGVLGLIHVNPSGFTDQFGVGSTPTQPLETSTSALNFIIETGAGPVYELPDNTTIAAYATLGFGSTSWSNEGVNVSTNALMLPGLKLAFEHWLFDWMAFRTGVHSRYYWAFQSQSFPSDNPNPNRSISATQLDFIWSTGIGITLGNFDFDGTLNTPFILNGPDFLGGNGGGMFGMASATYRF